MKNIVTVGILTEKDALHGFGIPWFNVVFEQTDSRAWKCVYLLNVLLTELPHKSNNCSADKVYN